jgi:Holliday junction resolvase RusA-like endonuclease
MTALQPVTVIIAGPAVAKGRARMTRRGFAYTPAKTRKYEAHGRLAAQLAMGGRPPLDVPCALVAMIELPIPASWSKRRRAAAISGDIRPTSRPDVDNYVKAALDAINGIVVADDSLVVDLQAQKKYGVNPRVVLQIAPLTREAVKQTPETPA